MNSLLSARTRAIALALLLAFANAAIGQSSVQGLIWKVRSKDSAIYLVGSIHVGVKELYPLPPIFDVAFAQASEVVEELPPDTMDSTQIETLNKKFGFWYDENDSIFNHIKPATADRLKKFCQLNNIPIESFQRLKPWIASIFVEVAPVLKANQNTSDTPIPGIDDYFIDLAKKANKPVIGLETPEIQCQLLSSLIPADQEKALNDTLDSSVDSGKKQLALLADWVKGNASAFDETLGPDRLPRSLLEDRNLHMADVAETYLKTHKSCLFIVGAAHMVGKEGIVALLQAKGYKVDQILSKD